MSSDSPSIAKKFMRRAQEFMYHDSGVNYPVTRALLKSLARFFQHEIKDGRDIQLRGIGTFFLRHRSGRISSIPEMKMKRGVGWVRTGKIVIREWPSAHYLGFKVAPTLKKFIHEIRPPVRTMPKS